MNPEVTITEEWSATDGVYGNYEVVPASARTDFLTRKRHRTVRSLNNTSIPYLITMLILDGYSIEEMNELTMEALQGSDSAPSEAWAGGTISAYLPLDRRPVLSIAVSGATLCNSVMPTKPVDLITGFLPTDHLSVALPNWPANMTLNNCRLDLTSHPDGSFLSQTRTLRFQDSAVAVATGDTELRFPLSALTAVDFDPTKVTGVQFRLDSSAPVTARVAAIRVLASDFVTTPLDTDTLRERLQPAVSRIGTLDFDMNWPTVLRASQPPGNEDPNPIDVSLTCAFNTGSMLEGTNEATFYLRQRSEDYMTQLDLNGQDMSDLNAKGKQPDFGRALYGSRTQAQLEEFSQGLLDDQNQWDLERIQDIESNAFIAVTLNFDGDECVLGIYDSESTFGTTPYTYNDFVLQPSQDYMLRIELEQNTMRVRIHDLETDGGIGTTILDTTSITDTFTFKRRKGRVGWLFDLKDGDAYVENVRTSSLMFAEYQSQPFRSMTAVDGIELFVSATPDRQLVNGLNVGPYGGQVESDLTRQNSADGAWKITNVGTALHGVMSDPFLIENWAETTVEFDLWFPQTAIDGDGLPSMYLLSDRGRMVEVPLPLIIGDQWQSLRFSTLFAAEEQTGSFKLVLLQVRNLPTVWWLDNLEVKTRSMSWSGRAHAEAEWFPFNDTYNRSGDGICLLERGFEAQVRGRALRQGAYIERLSFKPKYAQLGRLVWDVNGSDFPEVTAEFDVEDDE